MLGSQISRIDLFNIVIEKPFLASLPKNDEETIAEAKNHQLWEIEKILRSSIRGKMKGIGKLVAYWKRSYQNEIYENVYFEV